ncbi:MAG: hypothetical protein QF886_20585, partial [Planctomycetota bacterium]|nr:hypothetical protein [Planctomycetota bacterium]
KGLRIGDKYESRIKLYLCREVMQSLPDGEFEDITPSFKVPIAEDEVSKFIDLNINGKAKRTILRNDPVLPNRTYRMYYPIIREFPSGTIFTVIKIIKHRLLGISVVDWGYIEGEVGIRATAAKTEVDLTFCFEPNDSGDIVPKKNCLGRVAL